MTDPYADVDPPRARWIWWSLGLYCLSFVLPAVPIVPSSGNGSLWLGIHLFVASLAMLVVGLVHPGIFGAEQDATAFFLCGLPWLANPLLWWCLVAWADDRRKIAAATGLLALICGLTGIAFGFLVLPYWVWMASLAIAPVGVALTRPRSRGGRPSA